MADPFVSMEGALWVLPTGPNSTPLYLGCHMIDDVDVPRGGNEILRCPDPSGPNKYQTVGLLKSPPDLVSFAIDADIAAVIDYMETVNRGFAIMVTQMKAGRKNLVTNWDRAWIIEGCDIAGETLAGLAAKDENVRSTQAFAIEAEDVWRVYQMTAYRQSVAETQLFNSIFSVPGDVTKIYAVTDAGSGVAAKVWISTDGTWAAAAADPLAADDDIKAGLVVPSSRTTNRLIVFNGTTAAGSPASGAYSDDAGATWTAITIGAINAQFISGNHVAFALDINNMWVGMDDGYIYYSDNGGITWVIQEAGVITTDDWTWIQAVDASNAFAGGEAGVIAITADGGTTWSAGTVVGGGTADIMDGAALSALDAWVVLSDGRLFYTDDGAVTWTERRDFGADNVTSISFTNNFVGFLSYGTAASVIYMTKDGGATWEAVSTPTNSGINSVLACSNQLAYAAGDVNAATGLLLKLQPRS